MARRMRFVTWCKKDIADERRIRYSFKMSDGQVVDFTSDDSVSYSMMRRIQNSWVDTIELVEDEWHVLIYED